MGPVARDAAKPPPLVGRKYLDVLEEHVAYLRDLPAHGNRTLHLHPLLLALVSSFYNPCLRSLRTLEARSDLPALTAGTLDRLCRSTTSDALAAFDPELLRPAIASLRQQVPALADRDPDLHDIAQRLVAADGSYFACFADVAWALRHTQTDGTPAGRLRLNLQLDAESWIPRVVSVSGGDDGSEAAAFARDLVPGVLYLVDRNFVDFSFLRAVRERMSHVVVRVRSNAPGYEVLAERGSGDADRAAGVTSDRDVRLTGRDAPPGPWRLVSLADPKTGKSVDLLTSLTDPRVSAAAVGAAYRKRWEIELFFRWLKVWANFDHLISHSRRGVLTQFYVAVIAVLVMYVYLGRRVSRYAVVALQQIASGQATLEQMLDYLKKREHEKSLEKERLARRRTAAQKTA